MTPPTLFLSTPESLNRRARWVQYEPWQSPIGLDMEYHGSLVTQGELASLAHQAERVIAFNPKRMVMETMAQREPAAEAFACQALFGERVCLRWMHTTPGRDALRLELDWQVTGTLSSDVTVMVHVVDGSGKLIAQADGDPADGLLPLSDLDTALYERRTIVLSAHDVRVRVGLYERGSGKRLPAQCARDACVPVDNTAEFESH